MPIFWVEQNQPLPSALDADSNGLVAAGLDLSPERLTEAYSKGLFPWFSPGDPVLWWSPNPRMVLSCKGLHISHSLAKLIRKFDKPTDNQDNQYKDLIITLNFSFESVISSCAQRDSTWITPDIQQVYTAWHYLGHVHSVETWVDNQIVGGLYGVSIGKCFFGESMFSNASNTSKIALSYLVAYLIKQGVEWIDCQQETPHLASLGAKAIERGKFMDLLSTSLDKRQPLWGSGRLRANGNLEANHE